ncbi:sensor histidine kinase [Sphingomonas sp.]|uniref:sensor histidine kinase n=1 Tax=Sphingomonas sp. TaxID=28214 RepID=UPI003CC60204
MATIMFGALARRMGASHQSIGRFLIGALALGFLLLLAAGVALLWVARANVRHTYWVSHTYQVENAIEHAQLLVEQAEATRRGYLLAQQDVYLTAFQGFDRQIGPAIDRIATLTSDNPRQQRELVTYRAAATALATARLHSMALIRTGQPDAAVRYFVDEARYKRPRAVRDSAARLLVEEHRLLGIRDADLQRSTRVFYVVIALAGAALALLIGLTVLTVLRFTRDLAASRDRLSAFNEVLEDEVANRTADLRLANDEIQRFAYIVSHDLRSPLVNVMGFTAELETAGRALGNLVDRAAEEAPQLLDAATRAAAKEDLPEAIGFIRTSTAKMDRLINAILRLSREGRRVLTPEPLDLAEISTAAGDALQHLAEERDATIEVRRPMPGVVSDRLAVEQIVSNLLENAIKYLQPGRPGRITVAAARDKGRVLVEVVDNGRGIAPGDHQRIFDLFRRSGAQDQPGEGIGLAHVRALAYRLGGTIDVQSTLGEGSTFRLVLPATFQPESAAR